MSDDKLIVHPNMTVSDANEDEERVFKLQEEIEVEKARMKKNPPKTVDALVTVLLGTWFPLISDIAHYVKENATLTYDLIDQMDPDSDGSTRFTVEDAKSFELVLTYAKGVAELSLNQPTVISGSDEHKKLVEIMSTAEKCLQIVEESTVSDEPEEDTDTGEAN